MSVSVSSSSSSSSCMADANRETNGSTTGGGELSNSAIDTCVASEEAFVFGSSALGSAVAAAVAATITFVSARRTASAESNESMVSNIAILDFCKRAKSCCRCTRSRGFMRFVAFVKFLFRSRFCPRSSQCCIGVKCVCHRGKSRVGCVGAPR